MLIVIGPSCVRPRFVRAYAITLRISATTARCAARSSHIPRTRQHVARPVAASPGGRCGVGAGMGVNAGSSTSTLTGTEKLTGSLNSRVGIPGHCFRSTRKSWVVHSWPGPCWRVLTKAEEARSTHPELHLDLDAGLDGAGSGEGAERSRGGEDGEDGEDGEETSNGGAFHSREDNARIANGECRVGPAAQYIPRERRLS